MNDDILLPCVDLEGCQASIRVADIRTIVQHNNKKEQLAFTTSDKKLYIFSLRGSLESARRLFEQFGFDAVNGGALANIPKLVAYEPKDSTAYFSHEEPVQISRSNQKKVQHLPRLCSH